MVTSVMLALAILILALMALCNYLFSKKLLYPPVVFCSVWASDLCIVWMAGNFFYRISHALVLYCFGALFFSVGGLLAYLIPPKPSEQRPARRIWPWVLLLIASFPL